MVRKICSIALLSFLACIGAHSTAIPKAGGSKVPDNLNNKLNGTDQIVCKLQLESLNAFMLQEVVARCYRSLSRKDLEQTKNVCKIWQELAKSELERRESTKIIRFKNTQKVCDKLQQLRGGDEKNRCHRWRPALVLFFQLPPWYCKDSGMLDLIRELSVTNAKCFAVEQYAYNGEENCYKDLSLRYGAPVECLPTNYSDRISVTILSEAFLKKFNIDVIFPPQEMFRPEHKLFCGESKANKKLFAEYFAWRKEVPIKLAFIFTRETGGKIPADQNRTSRSMAKYRSDEITRWLRSLPEGKSTLIYTIQASAQRYHLKTVCPATGNGKDTAVLLFGGNDMYIDYEVWYHEYEDGSENLEKLSQDLKSLKERIDGWPENTQRIFFNIGDFRDDVDEICWNVFGDDVGADEIMWLPGKINFRKSKYVCDVTTIIFVGYPECSVLETSWKDSKSPMQIEDSESSMETEVIESSVEIEDSENLADSEESEN